MKLKRKPRARNADKARNSFVTRRAEIKLSTLADIFKLAAGPNWDGTRLGTLKRELEFIGFRYLDSLKLVYNWENRFMSVNYNLQMIGIISAENERFEEVGDCHFTLVCKQKGLKAKRDYSWKCPRWSDDDQRLREYIDRLSNPLITDRFQDLDIMDMEIRYREGDDCWQVSCESLIGSATWILIPPVLSMITPKVYECVKFLELFELIGDALVNNGGGAPTDASDQ